MSGQGMGLSDNSGADQSPPMSPTSHRRAGPASIRMPPGPSPAPVTFGQVLRDNPREILAVVVGTLGGVVLGFRAAVAGNGPAEHVLGVGAVAAALLLLASYVLRFWRRVLERPGWSRSRPRRLARLVMVYAWGVYFTVAVVVGLAVLAWRWWS